MGAVLAQAARFGAVGIVATLVHLGVAWLVHRLGGAAPLTANAAGFATAFAFSYLGHFYWTFGQRMGHPVRLPRFMGVSGVGFALTNLITWGVTTGIGQRFEIALALILFAVPLTTWLLSRLWAFK